MEDHRQPLTFTEETDTAPINISSLIISGLSHQDPLNVSSDPHTSELPIPNEGEIKYFIKGPIYLDWIQAAGKLGGNALKVALALCYLEGYNGRKGDTITLPNGLIAKFGVSQTEKTKALRKLRDAGLISVDQKPGQLARIIILEK